MKLPPSTWYERKLECDRFHLPLSSCSYADSIESGSALSFPQYNLQSGPEITRYRKLPPGEVMVSPNHSALNCCRSWGANIPKGAKNLVGGGSSAAHLFICNILIGEERSLNLNFRNAGVARRGYSKARLLLPYSPHPLLVRHTCTTPKKCCLPDSPLVLVHHKRGKADVPLMFFERFLEAFEHSIWRSPLSHRMLLFLVRRTCSKPECATHCNTSQTFLLCRRKDMVDMAFDTSRIAVVPSFGSLIPAVLQ